MDSDFDRYQNLRQGLWQLKIDLGRQAAAEEKNGNYKTADVLQSTRLRVAALLDKKPKPEPEQEPGT
jgi:hypothetical protein